MRKRILSFLLALSMVVSLLPAGAFAETSGTAPVQPYASSTELVVGSDGKPTVQNNDPSWGWTYDGETLTLNNSEKWQWDLSDGNALTCEVVVNSGVRIIGGTFGKKVTNKGTITGGTFNGEVINDSTDSGNSIIWDGTFEGTVENRGLIDGGTFKKPVKNHNMISGGLFAAGLSENDGRVTRGIFNGNAHLPASFHHVTVNGGKILKVNDVEVSSGEWDLYTVTNVKLTSDVVIKNVDGVPATDAMLSDDGKTVTFEMPQWDIVLNKTISDNYDAPLVMNPDTGKPELDGVGQNSEGLYIGNGWTYVLYVEDHYNKEDTLTLTSGSYDFSTTKPATGDGATLSGVNGRVVVGDGATITGGTFRQYLNVESGGIIKNCKSDGFVTNKGTIENGNFNGGTTTNYGTIKGGKFNSVTNMTDGTIEGGVFTSGSGVENHGTINGGIFEYGLNENSTNFTVNGGCFNADVYDVGTNRLPTNVYHVTVQGGKVWEVYGETITWDLYAAEGTKVQVKSRVNGDLEQIGSITGATTGNKIIDFTTESDGYTITFTMPNEDVVLKKKIYRTELVMKEDGTPDTTDVKQNSDGTYVGNDWTYKDNVLTLTGNSNGWDFTNTKPATRSGSELKEVNCEVIVKYGAIIRDGTFNKKVTNRGDITGGIFKKEVENYRYIYGGVFAAGLSSNSTGTVNGGYFNGNTGLTGMFHQVTVKDGKILKVNDVESDTGEWNLYAVQGTTVKLTANVEIATIKGEKIGEETTYNSSYVDDDKKTITFTMPSGDVELKKAYRTDGVLVMDKATGLPYVDDMEPDVNGKYQGTGWEYDGTTLTLTDGDYDFTNTNPADGSGNTLSEVDCEVVVEYDVTLKGGTFNKKVTNGGTIEDGTFKGEVENNFAIRGGTFEKQVTNNIEWCAINDGTFKEQVINNGVINDGTFKEQVINNGVINGGTFKEQVINNRVINNGIFVKGLSEESTNADGVYDGYFGSGTKLPEGFYSITVPGGKITEINNQDLTASVPGGWEKCFLNKSNATVTADVGIATINDEKIGSGESGKYFSDYVDSSNKKIYFYFTSGVENIVLGKIYDAPLVMKWDGYPDVTRADNVNGVWYGDGWNYDENTETLTLTGGTSNNYYRYFDLTIRDGGESDNLVEKEVRCKVVVRGEDRCVILDGGTFANEVSVEKGAGDSTIQSGVFNEKVTVEVDAKIENGTFNAVVENHGTIISNIGDFNGEVINDGTIKWGVFNKKVTNTTNGTINGGHFYSTVENEGTIIDGLFFKVPTGEKMTGGALALTDEEAPADAKNITIEGEGAKISALDSASVDSEKLYAIPGTEVEVLADTEITNLNGKKIGDAYESNYGWVISDGSWVNSTKCVDFTMPDEDVVLNKAAEPAPKPEEPKPEEPKAAEYTIKVDEYAKVNGKDTVTVKEGDTVSLTVSETPDGQTFDYWDLPSELQESLTKQDSTFNNKVQNLSFRMPKMGDKDATFSIKTGFRSAELPGDEEGPSALGTAAIVAVGGATAGVLVWQGVSLGVDSYLQLNLPDGVAIPTNRRELVKLLWETAGKPEVALPALYSDISAEEAELQKASRWAVANGLVGDADDEDASRFDPDHYVTKMDVFGAWLKLQKLLKNK